MLPKWHALISIFVFLLLFFIIKASFSASLIIALLSIVIDIDHYFFYAIKYKEYNFKKVYKILVEIQEKLVQGKIKKEDRPKMFLLLHSIEFLIVLLIANLYAFNSSFLYLIFISFLFHLVCDLIYGLVTKTFELTPYSIIYYLIKK